MQTTDSASLLIAQPWLYECIYPEAAADTTDACTRLIERFAPDGRLRILDVGCGTGRVLARLNQMGHECTGIDVSEPMMQFARESHPDLTIEFGDMRSFDLGKTFDVVICVGSTFTFNLTNADIHSSLERLRKHTSSGGMLILDILNGSRFLSSEVFKERIETRVAEGDFRATAISRHLLDRRRQAFRRLRTWKIDGVSKPVVDNAEYRLLFPLELEDYLSNHEFATLGMWDNKDLADGDLTGRRLYVAARAI